MNDRHSKEFEKTIRELAYRHHVWQVFGDFCELAALSLVNAVERREDREQRYLEIIRRYDPEEVALFPRLLATTALALDEAMDPKGLMQGRDFLGEMFMSLQLGSHWHGQFFTPTALCTLLADMTVGDLGPTVERHGFIRIQEPACGAGAMVIALACAMQRRGLNFQQTLHVTAIDVDPTAAHMAFIQLALMHVPAAVYVGNTLSMHMRECFLTPAHHMGLWEWKLWRRELAEKIEAGEEDPGAHVIETDPAAIPAPPRADRIVPARQPDLFEEMVI